MGHYCGFGPSISLSEKSSYASSFPQFIGTNGTSNNWDYGGWHNSAYSGCHQQVYAAGISPVSGYNHVQRSCENASVGPNDSDSTYWNIHTYQMPDHVQKICDIDFTSSDASDDCYWSVHTFPLSNTKAHVSQAQSCLLEGMVGDSMIVPPKAECEDMQVQKVSNHGLEDSTLECGIPNQLSQLCEKNGNNTTHENFGEQMEEEIAEYLTKSKHNEEEAQRKREEEEPGSGAMGESEVGLDLFFADAFELFDPGINTSVHQFIYALPVSYLQQLQQHTTCQPVVSTACALLAKNAEISLLNLQPSQLFFGEMFYTGKPPMRYDGFGLPTGDENEVIQSTISIELNWPWDPGSLGSDFKTKLLVLTYATLNAELLLPWDPGEHETFVRFIDTSGTTCRQKFLMFAVNWHFVNLKEFEGSGDCTSKDHQLQARRICSSYSLAGSLGEHSCRCDDSYKCSPIILKWLTASASVVLYLRTCTLSLLKSVSYLSINLLSKGVLMVSVLYSSIVVQVLQTTYISLLDMNAQGDFHATDYYHLSLHEFSAIIFALFKVCINIWNSADIRARELTGNVIDTDSELLDNEGI